MAQNKLRKKKEAATDSTDQTQKSVVIEEIPIRGGEILEYTKELVNLSSVSKVTSSYHSIETLEGFFIMVDLVHLALTESPFASNLAHLPHPQLKWVN